VHEYVDHESGRKGTKGRKQFAALFEDAHKRKLDCVLFWALDRFTREGMVPTILHLQRLASYGVGFHSYTEPHLATDNELVRNILLALLASLAKVEAQKINAGAALLNASAALQRERDNESTLDIVSPGLQTALDSANSLISLNQTDELMIDCSTVSSGPAAMASRRATNALFASMASSIDEASGFSIPTVINSFLPMSCILVAVLKESASSDALGML